jgi:hypothetical protein
VSPRTCRARARPRGPAWCADAGRRGRGAGLCERGAPWPSRRARRTPRSPPTAPCTVEVPTGPCVPSAGLAPASHRASAASARSSADVTPSNRASACWSGSHRASACPSVDVAQSNRASACWSGSHRASDASARSSADMAQSNRATLELSSRKGRALRPIHPVARSARSASKLAKSWFEPPTSRRVAVKSSGKLRQGSARRERRRGQ